MTGVLAQLISLAAYGNEWLATGRLPAGFYPGNPAFSFCNTVDFREVDGSNESVVAADPEAWYRYLAEQGCGALRLYYRPAEPQYEASAQPNGSQARPQPSVREHQLAGMIGGNGIWLIEAIFDSHSDFWANRWVVTRRDDPDKLIWSVNYLRNYIHQPTANLQFNLSVAAAELLGALGAILQFALQNQLMTWADFFKNAMARLGSDDPALGYYYTDLLPAEAYGLEARRLLYTAGSAWAFGGMGSWNDLGFENPATQQAYDEVSARLYQAVNTAFVASVNSV